jgi:hypothetical protein
MVDKEKVKQLLGHGLSNEVVATTIGCEPSYITELLSNEEFRNAVVELRMQNLTANSERDRSIDSIEDALINKLSEAVDSGMIYKPTDVLRAFAVLNNAKRRGVPAHESLIINQQIVNLQMPVVVTREFVTNPMGEVIETGGQTLVTMPAGQVLKQAAIAAGDRDAAAKYQKVAALLPAHGIEHGKSG